MRKPRIALFTGNYYHIRDGVSNTLNRLVVFLETQGYHIQVFGPWAPQPAFSPAGTFVPVYSIPFPGRSEYRIALCFPETEKQKLRDFNPDLIHIATPDILGFAALLYGKKHGIPVVSSYHTHFTSYLKYYHLGFLERLLWKYLSWFYRHCEHLYVPSRSMMEHLQNSGVKTKLKLWERGVDTGLFHPGQRDHSWRSYLGFNNDDIVVTFLSRLVWEKNLDIVAKTFTKLNENSTSIRTLIVGDGPAREELQRMMPNTVFTGHLEGDDVARAYASSELFFFPSDTETFGNVTLEAMSCGLPIVAADAVGSRSLVTNDVNGFLAPALDVSTFIEYIRKIAENRELKDRMASESRIIAERYDWNRILENLTIYYQEIHIK
ncbi:MAG: glycosyltransferase family 1 protein [Balneolales bacterium]